MILLIYIGTLWSWLQYSVFSFFSSWDEALSLLFIPLALLNVSFSKNSKDFYIWVSLIVFALFGLFGNIVYGFTNIGAALSDCFLNIKFFMLCYAILYIFRGWEWRTFSKGIKFHLNFLSIILLSLVAYDRVFKVFPVYEIRFGITSEEIIFLHPTFCAAAFFYLLVIRILLIEHRMMFDTVIDVGIGVSILLTLRFKAIAAVLAVIALIIYSINKNVRQFKWGILFTCLASIVLIAYKQIYGYFFSPYALMFPRGALLNTSFIILKQFFPFGTGFATFGSFLSGVYYSPVYALYHLENIPGMTATEYNAITDQYWPMIAGQAGIVGMIAMATAWYLFYKKFSENKKMKRRQFIAGFSCLVYILISSTSESAICNPVCMPLAIVLGLILAQLETEKKKGMK